MSMNHETIEDKIDKIIARTKAEAKPKAKGNKPVTTEETYTANVRVRDLPRSVDHALDLHATMKGKHKHEIIRTALEEYVRNHESELPRAQVAS